MSVSSCWGILAAAHCLPITTRKRARPRVERISAPPGGGPPDLNQFDLPLADGFIVLAAHPGQGIVLMGTLDAAVVDEADPFATRRRAGYV